MTPRTAIIAASAAALAASGCASNQIPDNAPAWYGEALREAEAAPYPELENPPETVRANMDQAYWAAATAEILAAADAMRAHPRASPAPAEGSQDAFTAAARAELEAARASHSDE